MNKHDNKNFNTQKGNALIIFVLILMLGGAAFLFSVLDENSIKLERNRKTYAALAEAKAALIGYTLHHGSKPGVLPCPDNDNDGLSNPNVIPGSCAATIGRLPWKQLEISMLKDGNSECLWYALSPVFNEEMLDPNRALNPINGNTIGTINLVDDADVPMSAINPVIAVIIAPNNPVNGQNRSGAATNYCPGDSLPANYLDTKGAVNNATGNVVGTTYTFKLGVLSNSFNDQITYITANDFFPLLRKRIAKEIMGNVDVPSGLFDYYQTVVSPPSTYPCPAKSVTGNSDCNPPLGNYVPYNDTARPLQYNVLGTWLVENGWFSNATYTYISSKHIKLKVTDPYGSYTCDANMNVVSCSSP